METHTSCSKKGSFLLDTARATECVPTVGTVMLSKEMWGNVIAFEAGFRFKCTHAYPSFDQREWCLTFRAAC